MMRYLEDLSIGTPFQCGSVHAEADEVAAFARRYAPGSSPLDAAAAPSLYTLAVCMGCMAGAVGDVAIVCDLGIDAVTAARPVHAGDALRVDACWTQARKSTVLPGQGVARIVVRGVFADGGDAIRFAVRHLVRCRVGP